ncbi:hypothetical protein [Lentibacillus amyloliquefaciens]|uniref:DUF4316 domain-containing protein n=1 Tax=Lentibacillus amyloliquefaciens TaxID=1472767 RepID=A0A0U4EAL8_9BACI|nr:hypothetical protein [Lentibacillus amyloliquefaciens]ALX47561.1 hypothetical protein AOX59_02450 [Lentibacillus amyloliquefaciens]
MEKDKREMYVGNSDVYLIKGLELDVEFDYISQTEHATTILELEDYIQEQGIHPVKSEDGYIETEEDTIVYVPKTGEIDYAAGFEGQNLLEKDYRTEQLLDDFYDDCLSFWKRENDKKFNFALAKSPEELALQDISSLEHNPTIPNGDLLDKETKQKWLQEKRNELLNKNTKQHKHDMDM